MQLKTILNRVHRLGSFVYGDAVLREQDGELIIEQEIRPRANGRAVCSGCGKRAPDFRPLVHSLLGSESERSPVFVPWQHEVPGVEFLQ